MIKVEKSILKDIYKKRPDKVRKYDYGLLVIIGGSEFYSGSPAFSALAAFRAGVDMTRIIAPKRAADIVASFCPDMAAYPLEGSHLNQEHLSILIATTEAAKEGARGNAAITLGGGLGRSEETQKVVLDYLENVSLPVVIDADAIYAVAKKPEIIKDKPFLFTPHSYEFFILTGQKVQGLELEDKIKIVQQEAARLGTTILLKGAIDIISNGKEVALNETGSPYLTKGGMGDTLAGIAGALMARGISPFEAGQAAAYINGKAGEFAVERFGESAMASDLINSIVEVLKS
jgi:hydroxyethylthiazole kinase-like uncharacterized protein yjeF